MSFAGAQEKTEDATPKRKRDARRKGTVARSTDLNGALVLLAITLVMPLTVGKISSGATESVHAALRNPRPWITTELVQTTITNSAMPLLAGLAYLVGVALITGIAVNFCQVGFSLSTQAMVPSFERINPLAGFKRLLSIRSTVEGLKAFAKCTLFAWIAYTTISAEWERLIMLGRMPAGESAAVVGMIIHRVMLRISITWLIIAVLDYYFQRRQTDKQLRMSKDELKQEMKEQEGSPELKSAQMRQRRRMSKGKLADRIKKADVVVTNPTHFAVALQYDRSKMAAPVVVAKGQDYLALRIRDLASEFRIPTVPNPPLARALYKECEVGDFVPRDLFQAVAEVLAYVYRTIKRQRPAA